MYNGKATLVIYDDLTKKEILKLNREKLKLSDQHRGIKDMNRLPNVIVVVDGKTEHIVLEEAKKLEIPVVCIVDSNTDPSLCSFPIPANDDSIRTIQLLISEIVNAIISVGKPEETKIDDSSVNSKDLNDSTNDEVKGASQ